MICLGKFFCMNFYPFRLNVVFHMETSHLICSAIRKINIYIKSNTSLKWVQWKRSQACLLADIQPVLQYSEPHD